MLPVFKHTVLPLSVKRLLRRRYFALVLPVFKHTVLPWSVNLLLRHFQSASDNNS